MGTCGSSGNSAGITSGIILGKPRNKAEISTKTEVDTPRDINNIKTSENKPIITYNEISNYKTPTLQMETIFGIKLSYLHSFIEKNGGRDFFNGKDTSWVCDNVIVKNYKDNYGLSVCQQLYSSEPNCVGINKDIKWFVSHAWKYMFLDVVDSLTYTLKPLESKPDEPYDVVIWFDLFSLHQSGKRETVSYEFLSNQFLKNVAVIGNVMMVADNWHSPDTLTRAWCVFEVFSCYACKGRFELAMTETETSNFNEAIDSAKEATTDEKAAAWISKYDKFGKIQTENCSAQCDLKTIQQAINDRVKNGFQGLDLIVIDALLLYIFRHGIYSEKEKATLTRVTGLIFKEEKRYDFAMRYFKKALTLREQLPNPKDYPTICTSKIDIAKLEYERNGGRGMSEVYLDLLKFAFVDHDNSIIRERIYSFFTTTVRGLREPFLNQKGKWSLEDIKTWLKHAIPMD